MDMINPVPEYINHFLYPLVGDRMLELGNKKSGNNSYKDYFTAQGIEHISIDWNGLDGALKLDLRQPIDLGQFDMVTNFGTTEHVSDQDPVWRNIHNAVKVGGVIISMCPKEGDWWWHGQHYPTEEFYTQFAYLNGYQIEHMQTGREYPNRNIDVRMKKITSCDFTMPGAGTIYFNHTRPR